MRGYDYLAGFYCGCPEGWFSGRNTLTLDVGPNVVSETLELCRMLAESVSCDTHWASHDFIKHFSNAHNHERQTLGQIERNEITKRIGNMPETYQ